MAMPSLVADINPGSNNSNPADFMWSESHVFFTAYTPEQGRELWVTDGTSTGTKLVAEIVPGNVDSTIEPFAYAGDICFFMADDGINGLSIWRSNGEQIGTYSLNTPVSNQYISIESVAFHQGLTYLALGDDIWVTDGTLSGTRQIASSEYGVNFLGSYQGSLLYRTYSEVKSISSSESIALVNNDVDYFYFGLERLGAVGAQLGNDLVFLGNSAETGLEPWLIDGETGGSRLIKDISFGTYDSNADWFTSFRDKVYFIANQDQLWVTDGTSEGTSLVKDLDPDYSYQEPRRVINTGQFLAILLDDSLWISDGTSLGTVRPSEINPVFQDEYIWEDDMTFDASGALYINGGYSGLLWRLQSPSMGDAEIQSLDIGYTSEFVAFGDSLLLSSENDSLSGDELWMLDISESFLEPPVPPNGGGGATSSNPASSPVPEAGTQAVLPSPPNETSPSSIPLPTVAASYTKESPVLGVQSRESVFTVVLEVPILLGPLQLAKAVVGTDLADVITGSEAGEVLSGGQGKDEMTGGSGPDAFLFENPGEFGKQRADIITDFDYEDGDLIAISQESMSGLSRIKFISVTGKQQAKQAGLSNKNFVYDEKNGMLYYDGNGKNNGWGEGGEFARLLGAPEIGKSDIVIV